MDLIDEFPRSHIIDTLKRIKGQFSSTEAVANSSASTNNGANMQTENAITGRQNAKLGSEQLQRQKSLSIHARMMQIHESIQQFLNSDTSGPRNSMTLAHYQNTTKATEQQPQQRSSGATVVNGIKTQISTDQERSGR